MSSGSHAVLALSASVAATLGLALVPSAAMADAGAAAMKAPKFLQVAKLDLDVAGYVETRQLTDTTSRCSPGVTYTQTNRYTFETSKYVRTRLTNTVFPGMDGVITTGFSRAVGSANITGGITGFGTTNYCAPIAPDPEPVPPTCVKIKGKTSVALTSAVKSEGNEDDPVPLGGNPMMLSVIRSGGAQDFGSCSGGNAGIVELFGTPSNAHISTSWYPGVSLSLPTGLASVKLFNLKRRDRLRRSIVVAGPCNLARASTKSGSAGIPAPGALNADGDCWITAKIVLSVRRSR